MPRSSRSSKSRKHSSKVSGSDDDLKFKEKEKDTSSNGGKDDIVSVRVPSEKRKHGKDLNGDVCEEYLNLSNSNSAKKRDEKSEKSDKSDRWNGGSSDEKGVVVNVENNSNNNNKEVVVVKVKDFSKSVGESKSKSSRRHDGESVSVVEKEKRKSEKESVRKESSLYKESKEFKEKEKEKEKERGSDRGRKGHSDKVDKVEGESSLKQVENQLSKRGKEITEWPIEEELRNPELEKELEKRMRRRGEGSSDKDKYQDDVKEPDDRRLSRSKDERLKDEAYEEGIRETRQRDEKQREDGERDRKSRDIKHRGENERYTKHRDDKYREDKHIEDANKDVKYKDEKYHEIGDKDERKRRQDEDRDYRHKEEKHREVRHRDETDREKRARDSKYTSRDYPVEPDAKRLRDDNASTDLYHRKTSNRDGSPVYDDRVSRYKDDKDRRRGTDKDESSEYRSRSIKEQRSESEKRDAVSERGRLGSRYPARDHHRVSKQEETKYRDYAYEDRARHNVHSSRDYASAPGQSDRKVAPKDDGYTGGDISSERRLRPEVDKSPSSTSNERRNFIRSDARKSLDLEESGPRNGGSKDNLKDGKGSRDDNDFSQVDNDNLSVSSPYTRNTNSHLSGNSKSLLPPPSPSPSTFRTGSDGPFHGSTEDERNKSNNRHRRMVDQNMGRTSQGNNNWKNVPNWPSPMATGAYINHPFQHVPPPMFHPLMQQFPPPMFGRPPMKLNPGLPYHVPDHGPPPLHNWDANNAAFGDESHLYNRLDWDRRTPLNNRGWDQSGEMWKNQNTGVPVDMQTGQQKEAYSSHRPNDEVWSGQTGPPDESEQNQMDIQTDTLNLEKTAPEVSQKVTESPQIFEALNEEENEALIVKAYLSRVDVSQDLTQPELYEQCTSMMDLEEESLSDEFDCKILFIEDDVETNVTDGASLFAAINDSVFQKAMFLYRKQKEEVDSVNKEKISSPVTNSEDFAPTVDPNKANEESKPENDEACIQKLDTEANVNDDEPNKPEEPMAMEVDHAVDVKQEEEEPPELTVAAVEESPAPSAIDLLTCKVEEGIESTNDDGGGGLVLSDVSNADVAVMPTESIEFGSVSLNRIHHHSPESTH